MKIHRNKYAQKKGVKGGVLFLCKIKCVQVSNSQSEAVFWDFTELRHKVGVALIGQIQQ